MVEEGRLAHIAGDGHPVHLPPPIARSGKINAARSALWAPARQTSHSFPGHSEAALNAKTHKMH